MRTRNVSFYLTNFLGFIACTIGGMAITGRLIELLTYSEFKVLLILAVGLGLTICTFNKLKA